MRAGPGFISLQGPHGEDGLTTPMFPKITKLIADLTTQVQIDAAGVAAVAGGGKHGDLYITPSGVLYSLDVIGTYPSLTGVWNIAGPDGDQGKTSTPPGHTAADHGITSPMKYIPGNYAELAAGPSITTKPVPPTP